MAVFGLKKGVQEPKDEVEAICAICLLTWFLDVLLVFADIADVKLGIVPILIQWGVDSFGP